MLLHVTDAASAERDENIAAVDAVLEETLSAGLLLHITDAASDERDENIAAVEAVLAEIGADAVPFLHVFNKIDLLDMPPRIDRDDEGKAIRVWVSAVTGDGIELLHQAMAERLAADWVDRWIRLPAVAAGRLRARLHEAGEVLAEQNDADGNLLLRVRLNRVHFLRLLREAQLEEQDIFTVPPEVAAENTPSYNPEASH